MAARRSEAADIFGERRSSGGGSTSAQLDAIALLLQDLIDGVQGISDQNSQNSDSSRAFGEDMLPQSFSGPLSTAALSPTHAVANQESVKCKANFGKAMPVTVQFDLDVVGVVPQAIVSWKVGGNTIVRTMDVTPGSSISGFADQVNVSVTDITAGGYGEAPATYNVTITISPGTRPATSLPPIYTALTANNLNSGSSQVVSVPLGTKGLMVYGVSAGGAASLRVDQYSAGIIGTDAFIINRVEVDSTQIGFIPLSAGAAQINITNEGGAIAVVTCLFAVDG